MPLVSLAGKIVMPDRLCAICETRETAGGLVSRSARTDRSDIAVRGLSSSAQRQFTSIVNEFEWVMGEIVKIVAESG